MAVHVCVSISEYVREGLTERRRERRKGRERDTAKENILAHVAVRAYLDAQDSRLSLSRGSRSSQCSHRVGGGGGGGGERQRREEGGRRRKVKGGKGYKQWSVNGAPFRGSP